MSEAVNSNGMDSNMFDEGSLQVPFSNSLRLPFDTHS